jgi:ABC-type amino acid transport system permease subunit
MKLRNDILKLYKETNILPIILMSGLMKRTQLLIHRQRMAIKVYLEIQFQNKNIHGHT